MATIGEKLAALVEHVEHIGATVERVETLARATNGRVTELERKEIGRDAREDERRRQATRAAAAAAASEARRAVGRAWLPPAGAAVFCVFLGWALERVTG